MYVLGHCVLHALNILQLLVLWSNKIFTSMMNCEKNEIKLLLEQCPKPASHVDIVQQNQLSSVLFTVSPNCRSSPHVTNCKKVSAARNKQ